MNPWHILIISLIMIHVAYRDYQKLYSDSHYGWPRPATVVGKEYSNAYDVQRKIDSARKRLARRAGINENEIKQKYFVRRQASIENAIPLQTSTKFK